MLRAEQLYAISGAVRGQLHGFDGRYVLSPPFSIGLKITQELAPRAGDCRPTFAKESLHDLLPHPVLQ